MLFFRASFMMFHLSFFLPPAILIPDGIGGGCLPLAAGLMVKNISTRINKTALSQDTLDGGRACFKAHDHFMNRSLVSAN